MLQSTLGHEGGMCQNVLQFLPILGIFNMASIRRLETIEAFLFLFD